MGLLDDAIREHLELKRRRGADAEEVARQEQEALGAPQRAEFAGATPAAAEPRPTPAEDARGRGRPEPRRSREPEPDARAASPSDDVPLDRGDPGRVRADRRSRTAEEPRGAAPPRRSRRASEDVLEETPDFLQETPEHDRLWFEQKPPRDFDFDR